jgi:hypothetical protein
MANVDQSVNVGKTSDRSVGSDRLELETVSPARNSVQLAESAPTNNACQLSECDILGTPSSGNTKQFIGSNQLELEPVSPASNGNNLAGSDVLEPEAVECEMANVDQSVNVGKTLAGDWLESVSPASEADQLVGSDRLELEARNTVQLPESNRKVLEPVPRECSENQLAECGILEVECVPPSSTANQLGGTTEVISELVSPVGNPSPLIVREAVKFAMANVNESVYVEKALVERDGLEPVSPPSDAVRLVGSDGLELETVVPQSSADSTAGNNTLISQPALALSSANLLALDIHPISPDWMQKADVEMEWCILQQPPSKRKLYDLGLKQVNNFTGLDVISPPVIETSRVMTGSSILESSSTKNNEDRLELDNQTTNDQHSTAAGSLPGHETVDLDSQIKTSITKRPKRITLADYKNRKSRSDVCVMDKEVYDSSSSTFIENPAVGIAADDGNVYVGESHGTEVESDTIVDKRPTSTNSDTLAQNANQDGIGESSLTDITVRDLTQPTVCDQKIKCSSDVPCDVGSAVMNVSVSGIHNDEDENKIPVDKWVDSSQQLSQTENYSVKPANQCSISESSCPDLAINYSSQSIDCDPSMNRSSGMLYDDGPTDMDVSVSSLHDIVAESNIIVDNRPSLTRKDMQTENDSIKPAIQVSVFDSGCTDFAVRDNTHSTDCDSSNKLSSDMPCDGGYIGNKPALPADDTEDQEVSANDGTRQFELIGPCSPGPYLSANVGEVCNNMLPDIDKNSLDTTNKAPKKKKKKKKKKHTQISWEHTLVPLDAQPECYRDISVKLPLCEIIKSNKLIDRRLLSKDDRIDYDILRTDGESSTVGWPIIIPFELEVNCSKHGDLFDEEDKELDLYTPKTRELPSSASGLEETFVNDADVLNHEVVICNEDEVQAEAPAAVGQERSGGMASEDQRDTGSEISHSFTVPLLELSSADKAAAVHLDGNRTESSEATDGTLLVVNSTKKNSIGNTELVELVTHEVDVLDERQEILGAATGTDETEYLNLRCNQARRESDGNPYKETGHDQMLDTDVCHPVRKPFRADIISQQSSSRDVRGSTTASDSAKNAVIEGCAEKSDAVDGVNVNHYSPRRVTDELSLSVSDARPVVTSTFSDLHLNKQNERCGNDSNDYRQENLYVKPDDGLIPSSSLTVENQQTGLPKNDTTAVQLLNSGSSLQSGKGESSRERSNWKKSRKFNDIWQGISRNWARVEMSRDADVFLPHAEGQKERCSRHYIRQLMSYFFHLPETVRNERTVLARQSLESTRRMARQELVFTDPKVGLSKDDYQNLVQTRPLLAKQLKLEAMLRKMRHSLQEIDSSLRQNDLEAELQFFKNCDLSRDQDQQCCMLLLASHVIYEEFNKQQLYDSSRLVFVLPDDLRLEDEIGRHTSIEGCVLFLDSWSLRQNVCFELFCLKVEIEDVQHEMGPEETTAIPEIQNESACRLAWLHSVRKKKLESITCMRVERLQMISDRLWVLLNWYK